GRSVRPCVFRKSDKTRNLLTLPEQSSRIRCATAKDKKQLSDGSRHDEVVLEAAGGDEKKDGAHGVKRQAVEPEMRKPRAAQDDAAGDVDVIACGNEITDDVEDEGHGLARENIAGEKDAGEKSEESELDGLRLRIG